MNLTSGAVALRPKMSLCLFYGNVFIAAVSLHWQIPGLPLTKKMSRFCLSGGEAKQDGALLHHEAAISAQPDGGWVQEADKESDDILTFKNMWRITASFSTISQWFF